MNTKAKEIIFQNELNHQNDPMVSLDSECNLSCIFCKPHNSLDFSDSKILEMYKQSIRNKIDSEIHIGGAGEPLIYPYIEEIFEEIKKNGKTFFLYTNLIGLKDKLEILKRYKAIITGIQIPIYGSTSDIHESITKTPGSFEKLLESIDLLKDLKIPIKYSTVLLKQNYEQIEEIIDLVLEKDRRVETFMIRWLQPDPAVNSYNECVVRFSDCIPYLKKILNIKIYLDGIPFCFFKEAPKNYRISNKEHMKVRPKIKMNEKCFLCEHDLECEGIFQRYTELFGVDELKPIIKKNVIRVAKKW